VLHWPDSGGDGLAESEFTTDIDQSANTPESAVVAVGAAVARR